MGRVWGPIVCLWLLASVAAAQSPKPAAGAAKPRAPAAADAAAPVVEVAPPLYYLKDARGELRPVPGFSFEDFVELYRLKEGLAAPRTPPAASIQRCMVDGAANGTQAALSVQLTIDVEAEAWTPVALAFTQAVLTEPPKYQGAGEHFVEFDAKAGGFTAWLKNGKEGRRHELTLSLALPLAQLGDLVRLRLAFPRAAQGELRLRVPLAEPAVRISDGPTLLPLEPAPPTATVVRALGVVGDVELSWQPAAARAAQQPAELEATGAVLNRLDGREVRADVVLTVRSYGEPFDRFRLRLPTAAEFSVPAGAGYSLKRLPAAADSRDQQVLVQLEKKTSGPVLVELSTQRSLESTRGEWVELSGPEVIGAVRQHGHIAVAVTGDWQVLWGPSRNVRQVDQWPESLRREDVVAGFEYFAQSSSLTARTIARKSHVSVEPEYLVQVEPDKATIEARLKYTIRGSKLFAFDVRMADWEFDSVEPDYLVALDGVSMGANQTLSIPLVQPTTGQVELIVRGHKVLAAGGRQIGFGLPQPLANSLGPAAVAILPAENVELAIDRQQTVGLSQQATPLPMRLPPRQQEPLFFRGGLEKASFAAAMSIHQQSIAVKVDSRVDAERTAARVEQKLTYRVAYEPAERVVLALPRALVGLPVEVQFEGRALAVAPLPAASDSAPVVHVEVALPRPCLGTFELTVRFAAAAADASDPTASWEVPLVMPLEPNLESNRVRVFATAGLLLVNRSETFKPVALSEPAADAQLELAAVGPQSKLDLGLAPQEERLRTETLVERAWVQTWLTQSARQDRAVFHFATESAELGFVLPEGAAREQMLLLLDGKPAVARVLESGRLAIRLDGPPANRRVLELRYHFPDGRPPRGAMALELPRIGRDAWIRRLYWQVVLPSDEHLVVSPADFTVESQWQWQGFFWSRQPVIEQAQLEAWVGATRQPLASQDTNRYLYSGMGKPGTCVLRTASRSGIVLAASGAALIAGLLVIYLPLARRPTSLLMASLAILAVGLLYPEPTVLVAQAASLGLGLALLAGLLERLIARRGRSRPPRDASRSSFDKGSTEAGRPVVGNQASTGSAPAPPPATLEWNV